jgi:hypothetical protein
MSCHLPFPHWSRSMRIIYTQAGSGFAIIEDHICSQSFPSFHRAAILALIIGKAPGLVGGILRLWSRHVGTVECSAEQRTPAGLVTCSPLWAEVSWLRPSSESQQDRNTHGARRRVPLDHVRTLLH